MLEFIIKYWIQVIFGLICSICAFGGKRLWQHHVKEKERRRQEKQKEFYDGMFEKLDERFQKTDLSLEQLTTKQSDIIITIGELREGVLSIQKESFKRKCKEYLEDSHEITEVEYLNLEKDYQAYAKLGGNGTGHDMFDAVTRKYYNL